MDHFVIEIEESWYRVEKRT